MKTKNAVKNITPVSSTCQISVVRRVLDLESEVMRGPGSIPTGDNIFHWNFLFSCSKGSDVNIGIIAILVHFQKLLPDIYKKLLIPKQCASYCTQTKFGVR